jgi:hypothetical protein
MIGGGVNITDFMPIFSAQVYLIVSRVHIHIKKMALLSASIDILSKLGYPFWLIHLSLFGFGMRLFLPLSIS